MSLLLPFAFALVALALGFWALVIYMQARRRGVQDEVLARLQFGLGEPESAWSSEAQVRNPLLRWACHRLWQAGLDLPASQVAGLFLALPVVALLVLMAFGIAVGGVLLVVLSIGIGLILGQIAGRRRTQIVRQLPDFLEHALRALMAGNTLEESFAEAAAESPEPLRTLFLGVSRQVRFGAPIEEALAQAADVHDLVDLRVLAMAARVNRRYGGSIRNMIRSLVQVIRARGTAARELRALTAETRFSAMMLFAIPLGITSFILLRNPGFYGDMWDDGTGRALLLAAAALQAAGGVLIWRMLRATEAGA